ncbi:ArsR/SmtB family transcription factor [Allorhizocola rhizosphaerae]|uniref:ArsR/SmtB family transcription factor n=1 Tax=Allorhizocola rhizosphaerae TaxID=1872709 RepID=UPI000E3B78B4|nr:metalloregulator ArsR/SmtB family transcription factor [Allorhizocola rhizosphaerae]
MVDQTIPPLSQRPLDSATAGDLAQAFKALGDPVRLQILSRITSADGGEVCVCDMRPGFDLTGPTISHHLRLLREAGLIDGQRRGTWVYYRPRRERLAVLAALLAVTPALG